MIRKNRVASLIACLLSIALLATPLTSCMTATESEQDQRPKITLSFVQTGEIADFIMNLKEKFPDYNLTVVQAKEIREINSNDNGLLRYQTEHDKVADIVIDSNLTKELPGLETTFADLSGKSYSAKFKTSYLNDASMGGSVYYLPLYITVKGLICNKSLFDEKGWSIPTNYEEYSRLLEQISNDPEDIRPVYDETNFKTANYCLSTYYSFNEGSTLAGYQALEGFNNANSDGSPLELDHTLSYVSQLVDAGGITEGELGHVGETDSGVNEGFYNLALRKSAMAFASGATWNILKKRGCTDEFVMIPLFSQDCPDGYALEGKPMNIGVSRAAMEDPQKSKAIDDIMAYIASEEGQRSILDFSSGVKSPCYGIMNDKYSHVMQAMFDALENGCITETADFKGLGEATEATLAEYFFHNEDNHVSVQDINESLVASRNQATEEAAQKDQPITAATTDFTLAETKYLLLKAMAQQTNANFAVLPQTEITNPYGALPHSESLLGNVLSGNLTANNVKSLIRGDTALRVHRVTGEQLLSLMDYNTSTLMLYGAKLHYTYNAEKDTYYTTGATLPDGTPLDPAATYTLASTSHATLPENILFEEQATSLSDAMIDYCAQQESISPIGTGEFEYSNQ